jgi:YggT family protein
MIAAINYIVDILLSLALFVVLARLLLQWARADFRNPLCQAIVRLTNPLILPLRRILPPVGKVDTASVVAVLIIATVNVAITTALHGGGLPSPVNWVQKVALQIVSTLLSTYFYAILLYALLSLIAPGGYSPMQSVLATICEPVLRPFRRLIPSVAGLDLSPLWACIAIQAIRILLASFFGPDFPSLY